MGANTTNGWFYLPALGASGQAELDLYNAGQEIADAQIEANKNALAGYPVIWSGLGMTLRYSQSEYLDTVLASGITELRIDIPDYQDTAAVAASKAFVIDAVDAGAKVIWGVSSNSANDSDYTITAENWGDFEDAITAAATWAQANGVFEFQLGNEEESHNRYRAAVGGIVRSSNVCTAQTTDEDGNIVSHGFDGTNQVTISNVSPENMGGTYDIVVDDATHFHYTAAGDDESNVTWKPMITDIPDATIITNMKALATDIQAIFTNGNVSYTITQDMVSDWVSAGKGDIDIIAANVYRGGATFNDDWETAITALFAGFGASGCYITEFNLSYTDVNEWSADESVQAAGLTEMIDFIKDAGITRAIFFQWKDGGTLTGVVKADETYREYWNSLVGSETGGFHIVGQTTGDILYFNGTIWTRLAKGTEGQVLTMGASIPGWAAP